MGRGRGFYEYKFKIKKILAWEGGGSRVSA